MKIGTSYKRSGSTTTYKTPAIAWNTGEDIISFSQHRGEVGIIEPTETFLVVDQAQEPGKAYDKAQLYRVYKVLGPSACGWVRIFVSVDDVLDSTGRWDSGSRNFYIKEAMESLP